MHQINRKIPSNFWRLLRICEKYMGRKRKLLFENHPALYEDKQIQENLIKISKAFWRFRINFVYIFRFCSSKMFNLYSGNNQCKFKLKYWTSKLWFSVVNGEYWKKWNKKIKHSRKVFNMQSVPSIFSISMKISAKLLITCL